MLRLGDPTVSAGKAELTTPYATGELPANTADIHRQFTCPGSCTSQLDGADPINILAVFHHMHCEFVRGDGDFHHSLLRALC